METRTIRLNQSAINSAIQAFREHGQSGDFLVSRNCPVFHALKEAGFAMESCGLSDAWTERDEKHIMLDSMAKAITHLPARDWENVNPIAFSVDIIE